MTDRCEIYVKGVEDCNALVPLVESAVGGQSDGTSVTSLTKRKRASYQRLISRMSERNQASVMAG
jgi:hypothetical protein